MLGYFASGDSSTRNLDHGTNCVLQLIFLEPKLFTHFSSGGVDDVLLEFKLTRIATSGTMISGNTLVPSSAPREQPRGSPRPALL